MKACDLENSFLDEESSSFSMDLKNYQPRVDK
jgi:hypothetical protein